MSKETVYGRVLRRHRQSRRMTQGDVAERLGVSVSTVSKVEAGKQSYDHERVELMAQVLDLDPSELHDEATSNLRKESPLRDRVDVPTLFGTAGDDAADDELTTTLRVLEGLLRVRQLHPVTVERGRGLLRLVRDLPLQLDLLGEGHAIPGMPLPVGALPTQEVRAVDPMHVAVPEPRNGAQLEEGPVYVDPAALAFLPDRSAPAVHLRRYGDGTVEVDRADVFLRRAALADFDPARHRLRAAPLLGPGDLADVYFDTELTVTVPDGATWRLRAARPGEEPTDAFPDGASSLSVLTAHNPRGRLLDERATAMFQDRLREDLAALDAGDVLDVDARSTTQLDEWSEPSLAVVDADEQAVRRVARDYRQNAWFEVTADGMTVRWTEGGNETRPLVAHTTGAA